MLLTWNYFLFRQIEDVWWKHFFPVQWNGKSSDHFSIVKFSLPNWNDNYIVKDSFSKLFDYNWYLLINKHAVHKHMECICTYFPWSRAVMRQKPFKKKSKILLIITCWAQAASSPLHVLMWEVGGRMDELFWNKVHCAIHWSLVLSKIFHFILA